MRAEVCVSVLVQRGTARSSARHSDCRDAHLRQRTGKQRGCARCVTCNALARASATAPAAAAFSDCF